MLTNGLLGIALHARVYAGIYLQSVTVYVVLTAVGLAVFFAPTVCRVVLPGNRVADVFLFLPAGIVFAVGFLGCKHHADTLAEVWGRPFFVIDDAEVELKRQLL